MNIVQSRLWSVRRIGSGRYIIGASEMFQLIDNVRYCILDIFTGSIGYSFGAAVHRALNPGYSRCLQNGPGPHNGCTSIMQYYVPVLYRMGLVGPHNGGPNVHTVLYMYHWSP